jgi:DNA oxidative demethylase
LARARIEPGLPPGFVYEAGFLSEREERALLEQLETLAFEPIVIRGQAAKRTARHFGLDYDYEARGRLTPGEQLPDWLMPLRNRCGEFAGVPVEALAEALVQRYPPGSTIGWHRDAPMFGIVVGVSLASDCRMRFRRAAGAERSVRELVLERRSAYVLSGASRWSWQHSIPPTREFRYSVTFRTLRSGAREVSPEVS